MFPINGGQQRLHLTNPGRHPLMSCCKLFLWKLKTVMVNNSTNVNKTDKHLSPQFTEHKKDHDVWRWKSRSWITISTSKRCIYLQLWTFVGGFISSLRYLCLFAHNGVQHISCCLFVLFFFVLCSLCCQFLWIVHLWLPLRYSLALIEIETHMWHVRRFTFSKRGTLLHVPS